MPILKNLGSTTITAMITSGILNGLAKEKLLLTKAGRAKLKSLTLAQRVKFAMPQTPVSYLTKPKKRGAKKKKKRAKKKTKRRRVK